MGELTRVPVIKLLVDLCIEEFWLFAVPEPPPLA